MSSTENVQNSLNVETPEQIETTNIDVPATSGVNGIDKITTSLNYSNNFTNFELEKARENILSSGLDLKNTKYVNIVFNRLQPKQIGAFINHLLYSKKVIPANDMCSAFALNSMSLADGKILNTPNGQVLVGPVGTGPYGSDAVDSISNASRVNRTRSNIPTYINLADGHFGKQANAGGFSCHGTENLLKRYDRLVKDQGQLTKGVEKAFDNKGYPVLEAQAALECYGKNKICFTKEIIGEILFNTTGRLGTMKTGSSTITILDRKYMNEQNISNPTLNNVQESLVSRAQTLDDAVAFVGRQLSVDNNAYNNCFVVYPLTNFPNFFQTGDYCGFDNWNIAYNNVHPPHRPLTLSRTNLVIWIARYFNGWNYNFVGYVDSNGQVQGQWGTKITEPSYTDLAGYNSYVSDTNKFTPYNPASCTVEFPRCEEAYNVQDILTGLSYIAEKYGQYSTPYGYVNMNGSTGVNQEVQIFTCPTWSRVGHLLGFLEYDLDYSTHVDNSDSLLHNKIYHYIRYKFGLFLTSITKFIGACDNASVLTNLPRTSHYTRRLLKNLYSMLNFSYFMPDEQTLHFIYPLAKTYGADYSNNLLWTCNGTYTPGNLFNDYSNNVNIVGTLANSTADLSYRVYLEDYQWWRGDLFGNLNDQDLTVMYSAGSSLSLIRQARDNNESIVLEHGYYASQGCDTCAIDMWANAYGSTTRMKVRMINWNNTDTVIKFIQPVLFAWSGVVTALHLGGLLSTPTADTFVPGVPIASYAYWANLANNVKTSTGYDLDEDF